VADVEEVEKAEHCTEDKRGAVVVPAPLPLLREYAKMRRGVHWAHGKNAVAAAEASEIFLAGGLPFPLLHPSGGVMIGRLAIGFAIISSVCAMPLSKLFILLR